MMYLNNLAPPSLKSCMAAPADHVLFCASPNYLSIREETYVRHLKPNYRPPKYVIGLGRPLLYKERPLPQTNVFSKL